MLVTGHAYIVIVKKSYLVEPGACFENTEPHVKDPTRGSHGMATRLFALTNIEGCVIVWAMHTIMIP
jgi:hypothetical protein